MRPLSTQQSRKTSEVYNLHDYEVALLVEDPHYQDAQQILLAEISRIARNTNVNILEIGGGSGLFTLKLASSLRNADVTVIEPDEEWFEVLKTRASMLPNITPELCTIEQFMGNNRAYDICCASFAFHHIPYENQQDSIRKIYKLLKSKGHFVIVDKFIPTFKNEYERKVGLKTYHGYFLSWKKQRGLGRGIEFEVITLRNNLERTGDYKISLNILDSQCQNYFNLLKRIKIAPFKIEPGIKKAIAGDLVQEGFSVNAKKLRRIHHHIELANWGIFLMSYKKI